MDLGAQRERWILWIPVAFGAGVALYFSLGQEPARWFGPWALLVVAALGYVLRRSMLAVVLALGLGAGLAGFTLAVERTASLSHPVLERATGIVGIEGRIVEVEPVEKGYRLVLDRVRVERKGNSDAWARLDRVRVRVNGADQLLRPGQWVSLVGGLSPPQPPVAPGAYDFSRAAWYMGLSAVGFALGPPQVLAEEAPAEGWKERAQNAVTLARLSLSRRIAGTIDAAGLPPGTGSTAAAIVTAERGPIPTSVLDAFRNAGLAHILVIAGMHMSMVAGLVYVAFRALFAAIPVLALNYPIKKWAASLSLAVAFGYLVISGAPVPTQRAFIMNAIVLAAVLIDRDALSLRSIGWAAMAVLAFHPEALIGPSFQMSFAAVYGLISAYEVSGPRLGSWRRAHHGWWRGPALYIAGILLTTQVAGTATALYTVYHFDRYATYSLLGNLLAVPVVGFWVMPAALLGFALMPLGLDGLGWVLMGHGVALVGRIGAWVSSLPGSVVDVPRMPISCLVVFTLGGLWLVLWRGQRRYLGLAGMAVGLALWALTPQPDILIDSSGRLVALKSDDGSLTFSGRVHARRARLAWSRIAGQGEAAPKWDDETGPRCDSLGCVQRIGTHAMAFAKRPEALAEDCRRADLVVVPVPYAAPCPSAKLLIDGFALRAKGTHAVWLEKRGYRVLSVADWQGQRPWSPWRRSKGTGRSAETAWNDSDKTVTSNTGASDRPNGPEP